MDLQQLDTELASGKVSADALRQLWDAECLGQATSMSWLEKRLKILADVAARGQAIEVHGPQGAQVLKTHADFDTWCKTVFTDAHAAFFDKPQQQPPAPHRKPRS